MGRPVGSLRGLMVDSIPYDVVAESDAKIAPDSETTGVKTTGGTLFAVERKCEEVTGVEIDVSDPAVKTALKELVGKKVPISFEWAGGQVYSAPSGMVSLKESSSKTGRAELTLIPDGDWLMA